MSETDLTTLIYKDLHKNSQQAQNYRRWIAKFMKVNYKNGMDNPAFFAFELFLRDINKSMSNATTLSIVERFFSDPDLLHFYYETHNAQEKELIGLLSWDSPIDYKTVKKIFKEDLFKLEKTKYDIILEIKPGYQNWTDFMRRKNFYHGQLRTLPSIIEDAKISFSFPRFVQLAFRQIMPKPKGYHLRAIQLPKDKEIFTGEIAIHKELPALLLLIQQGGIQFTSNSWLKETELKKIHKKLQLHSFNGDPEYLKAFMLVPLLLITKDLNPHCQAIDIIKAIFRQKQSSLAMLQAALFPFEGLKRTYKSYGLDTKITWQVLDLLQLLPPDVWISTQNIQTYIKYHFLEFNLTSIHATLNFNLKASEDKALNFKHSKANQQLDILHNQVIKGTLMMAASFGLLDLAYDCTINSQSENSTSQKQQERFAEDFTACKITPLGLQIYQGHANYTLPEAVQLTKYELEKSDLIINVQGDIDIAMSLLEQWVHKENDYCLRVDLEKILRNCHTKKELIASIKQLKEALGIKLPNYWKQIFMQVLQRADKIQHDNMAIVYRLAPEDKELHRCLVQDPALKNIVLRAEQYTILIEHRHLGTFHKRLAQKGYLVNRPNMMQTNAPHFDTDLKHPEELVAAFDQLILK